MIKKQNGMPYDIMLLKTIYVEMFYYYMGQVIKMKSCSDIEK